MRLIDADSLIENLSKWLKQVDPTHPSDIPPMDDIIVSTIMTIEEEPTVDPFNVICNLQDTINTLRLRLNKRGEWLIPEGHPNARFCSVCKMICHEDNARFYNYCPNCGAKMEGNDENR